MKDINVNSSALKNTSKKSNQNFTPKERHNMIEKEAYGRAYARSFDKGDALGDWLTAEQRVDSQLEK